MNRRFKSGIHHSKLNRQCVALYFFFVSMESLNVKLLKINTEIKTNTNLKLNYSVSHAFNALRFGYF